MKELVEELKKLWPDVPLQEPDLTKVEFKASKNVDFHNLFESLNQKISQLVGAKDILSFPTIKGPDLVLDTKKFWLAGKNKFASLPQAAEFLAQKIQEANLPWIEKVEQVGIFVNLRLGDEFISQLKELKLHQNPNPSKIIIDYGSPNIAKQMSVGHLRSSVIGESLARIYGLKGNKVLRRNYIGDWWTPFGKLVVMLEMFFYNRLPEVKKLFELKEQIWTGAQLLQNLKQNPLDVMAKLYAAFKDLPKKGEDFKPLARRYFALIEKWDEDLFFVWKLFRWLSIKEYEKMFAALGIQFDLRWWEYFAQKYVDEVLKKVDQAWFLHDSEGAKIVVFEKTENWWQPLKVLPSEIDEAKHTVMLLKKQDWTTLYATRDLATLWLRLQQMWADKVLYVVGREQRLHFELLFALVKALGWIEDVSKLEHVDFGLMLFEGKKMSSREGNVVYLAELLEQIKQKLVQQFGSRIGEKEAQKIAVAALIFDDLKSDRQKDVKFDITKATKLDGDSWVYVLYGLVRLRSLIAKISLESKFDAERLTDEEKNLLKKAAWMPEMIQRALGASKPHIIAQHLLLLVKEFNSWYANSPKILEQSQADQQAKKAFLEVLEAYMLKGIEALNLPTVNKM